MYALAADNGMEGENGLLAPRRLSNADQKVWWRSCSKPGATQTNIPFDISAQANHYGVTIKHQYNVRWPMSPEIDQMIRDDGADPLDFYFRVSWAENIDKNFRWWPWLHTNSKDFFNDLAALGSVLVRPTNLATTWRKGFMNVIPDALGYFARMGQVIDRKIIPKFLVFGWSKGATYSWPIGRWRPDLIQGSVLVHGCNSQNTYRGHTPSESEKADRAGLAPHLFFSSPDDEILHCSHKDTKKQVDSNLKVYNGQVDYQRHEISPCSHHPTKCASHCPRPLEDLFFNPFWEFTNLTYHFTNCEHWTTETECTSAWCKWDAELSFCGEMHPTYMNPSCATFCDLQEVASCTDISVPWGEIDANATLESDTIVALEENCTSSYVVLPIDQANADGMHAKCEVVDGLCVEAVLRFQCFFQDRCH